jgi:cell pole-organizing protein PopZ
VVTEAVLSSTSSLDQDEPIPDGEPARVAADLLDADGTPLDVLDEAALHEIVRQTLRSELQGELGERITRNVRKLVRAEINRALIARDLD